MEKRSAQGLTPRRPRALKQQSVSLEHGVANSLVFFSIHVCLFPTVTSPPLPRRHAGLRQRLACGARATGGAAALTSAGRVRPSGGAALPQRKNDNKKEKKNTKKKKKWGGGGGGGRTEGDRDDGGVGVGLRVGGEGGRRGEQGDRVVER